MIEARQISMTYRSQKVLDQASLTVPAGRCVMLMGDNGSGKTTLLHVMVGLRRPDTGQVIWQQQDLIRAGRRSWKHARLSWGFLPQHPALPPAATVAQLLKFTAKLRGCDPAMAYDWLERVGLAGTQDKRIEMLSGGMRQRLGIALTLFFKPALIVLDEPASSLDTGWREQLATWIGQQTDRGAAVLVTTQLREPWRNTDHRKCIAGKIVTDDLPPASSTPEHPPRQEAIA